MFIIIILDAVLAFLKMPSIIRNYLFREHKFFTREFLFCYFWDFEDSYELAVREQIMGKKLSLC